MSRKNISTNTPSEKRVGYSRAVIIDNEMHFSGTTSMDKEGKVIGKSTYEQTDHIFKKISSIMKKNGFLSKDVINVDVFLTDINELDQFDKVFFEHFGKINPTCTLVEVSRLFSPKIKVEIKVMAKK